MRLIIGLTVGLLLAVFVVAYLYFSNLTGDQRSNDKMLAGVPADASMIFNFSNDRSVYEIFQDYPVFEAIIGSSKTVELQWLKEILLDNRELYNATQGQKVFLSFHPLSSDSLQYLWTMPLKEKLELKELEEIIRGSSTQEVNSHEDLLEINYKLNGRTFFIGMDRGIAKGSFSKTLVQQALSKDSKKITKEYVEEVRDAILKNDDVLASLHINHHEPGFLNVFFKQNPNGNFGLFSSFSAYTGLDLNYKSDALMLNGKTRITERHNGYLNLFLNQKPVKNTIKRVIPYNNASAVCYGLSNYEAFHSDLKKLFTLRKELPELEEQIRRVTAETGINPDRDIKKLWGNEFSNMQQSSFENLAVIRISNGRQLQFYLEPLSAMSSEQVRKMNYENLFYYYLGDPIKKYAKPFFAITDNLLILSNSAATVQQFLNDYNADRMMYKDDSFTRFDQFVADQSNISFTLHYANSRNLLKSLFKKPYAGLLENSSFGFGKIYGLSYQLTSNSDHFFTNFYLGLQNSVAGKTDSLVYKKESDR